MANRKQRRSNVAKILGSKKKPKVIAQSTGSLSTIRHAYITNEHFLCGLPNWQNPSSVNQKATEAGIVSCNNCQRVLFGIGKDRLARVWDPEVLS